jgi:hypothetical protein
MQKIIITTAITVFTLTGCGSSGKWVTTAGHEAPSFVLKQCKEQGSHRGSQLYDDSTRNKGSTGDTGTDAAFVAASLISAMLISDKHTDTCMQESGYVWIEE